MANTKLIFIKIHFYVDELKMSLYLCILIYLNYEYIIINAYSNLVYKSYFEIIIVSSFKLNYNKN